MFKVNQTNLSKVGCGFFNIILIKIFGIIKSVIIPLLFLIIPYILSAQQGDVRFKNLSREDGLSQTVVNAIVQDYKGLMWFGTQDGLNKFDGLHFTVYRNEKGNPKSLSDNWIWSLYEDWDGVLWIGTNGGGLNRFDQATGYFTRYRHDSNDPNSLSANIVQSIFEDQSGLLWIGTQQGGLNRFNRTTELFTHYKHDPNNLQSISSNDVRAIYKDSLGTLWVGTGGGGLNRLDPDRDAFIHYRYDPDNPGSLGSDIVLAIYEDYEGKIWIGTHGGGLNCFNRETETFTRYRHNPNDIKSLKNDIVSVIFEDRSRLLWIGTRGGGLNHFHRSTKAFTHFKNNPNNPLSISHNDVRSIYEDNSGLMWIGTYTSGIDRYNPNAKMFVNYQYDANNSNSLNHNTIWSIIEDRNGIVWIGTDGGGINRLDRSTNLFTHYKHDPRNLNSLSGNRVRSIHEGQNGLLWIGTDGAGLNRFDPRTESFVHYQHNPTDSQSLSGNRIRAILEDQFGILWIGTYSSGLNRFNPQTETFTHFTFDGNNPNSLSHNDVRGIYEDRFGTIWVLTSGGLNKFDRNSETFKHFKNDPNNPNSLNQNLVRSICEDQSGILWIGTRGGLNKFNQETESFTHYDIEDGLPSNVIYGILEHKDGLIWISTSNGLSHFNSKTEIFRNYGASDGLQSDEFTAGSYYKNKHGELFFGGTNGFNTFYPDSINDNPYIPPVVFIDFKLLNKSVAVNDESILKKSISETDTLILSHKDRIISFEFSTLSYIAPEKNKYAYILEGFSEDWIYLGNKHDVTFTNLEPGHYTLRIRGSNNDGVWNLEGASLTIIVTPPFWQTGWFRGIIFIVITILLIGIYQTRTRSIRKRNKKLEKRVTKRTAELQKSEEKYRYLVENINDIIFSIVDGGRIAYISPAVEAVLGYKASEIINKFFQDLIHPEDLKIAVQKQNEVLSGAPVSWECRTIKKSGDICWIHVSEKPAWVNHKIDGSRGVLTDITERKELESQLVQAQKLESIGQLAAGIAHEINTPTQYVGDNTKFFQESFSDIKELLSEYKDLLDANISGAAINGLVERVLSKSEEIDLDYLLGEVPNAIQQTLEGINRVAKIVLAMKDFSHPGKKEKTAINLNRAMESTITVSRNEWKYVAEMDMDFDDSLPMVPCIPGEFNQVILNMIVNAAHAIEDIVGDGSKGKGLIKISTKRDGDWAEICISDTGSGIPDNVKSKIFDPFFTTKEVGKGTGQGLSIAYKIIVKKHNGKMDFETELGKGTTFKIALPLDSVFSNMAINLN